MSECKWKDGKFYPCDSFEPGVTANGQMPICIYCDTVISKPEPSIPKNDRELFLEAVIETYANMMEKSNTFNNQMLEEFKKMRDTT